MRYWLDSEFIDTGSTIDLISIGIVAEDGREFYAQSSEFNHRKASEWVQKNVLPHLSTCPYTIAYEYESGGMAFDYIGAARGYHMQGQCIDQVYGICHRCPWRNREQLKRDTLAFMDMEAYGKPELWGWCGSYDHVALCQVFGTMMDLPAGWPHYIKDIQYLLDERNMPDDLLPVVRGTEHNALNDARYIRQLWLLLTEGVE